MDRSRRLGLAEPRGRERPSDPAYYAHMLLVKILEDTGTFTCDGKPPGHENALTNFFNSGCVV